MTPSVMVMLVVRSRILYSLLVDSVTLTSTRTPIYKAFAKGENIGDVTAKGGLGILQI